MIRTFGFALALPLLMLALPTPVGADDKDAKTVAQEILTKGAALFDTRDAAAMAATYLAEARVALISKDGDSGDLKTSLYDGRAGIEGLYKDMFKDKNDASTSRNTVEAASYAGPDILIIQGTFQPDVANRGVYPFVQVRTKVGEKWLVKDMQVFVISRD